MADRAKSVRALQGDWMAREPDGWRVRVPTPNGNGFFRIAEYGSSTKAYNAAREFQIKMYKQYKSDLEYKAKNGELPEHETINLRNRSGVPGCYRMVYPNLYSQPNIVWFATWRETRGGMRIPCTARFSTAEHGSEATCKKLAIEMRKKMIEKHGLF